jgi:uncharacterized protein (TIGR03437 family)
MQVRNRRLPAAIAFFICSAAALAATFGTVVPVRGLPSDLALDARRGRLYVANLSASRVEVMNTTTLALEAPLAAPMPPSAVSISPDNRFLVVGQYDNFLDPELSTKGGLTIYDLDAQQRRDLVLANPVLAVEFGAGSQALVVTTGEFLLLDPLTGLTTVLTPTQELDGQQIPVPFVTFPAEIIQAATGVSGDRQTIVVLAQLDVNAANQSAAVIYRVGSSQVGVIGVVAEPPLGPRAVSVNLQGTTFLLGWGMFDIAAGAVAQVPHPIGDFRLGGHAWDVPRNRIYVDIPVEAGEAPVLHVMDPDNLTVRERLRLPQTITGGGVFSPDNNTLYTISEGGVLILPVGSLDSAPRVAASQEDVLFLPSLLADGVLTRTIEIVDPSGGNVDFRLSLPASARGIRLSRTSGVTPATVQIEVDPLAYEDFKGTTTVALTIDSTGAVNIPPPVRLLINNAGPTQRGRIVNVPGKLVDILADPARNRFYILRQDKNLVLVYDSVTFEPVNALRTGNTPTSLAITEDQRFLLVGNDNSHLINVFDLQTLQPSNPILVEGAYPRSVAVGNGAIWTTARVVGLPDLPCNGRAITNPMYRVNFARRTATPPVRLGVFCNEVPPDSVLRRSPSGQSIILAMPNGAGALWDASVPGGGEWVLSRTITPSGGALESLGDNFFVVDNQVLDQALIPVGGFQTGTGASSGIGFLDGRGLRSTAAAPNAPGTLERINLETRQTTNATALVEAPMIAATLNTPRVGQIGQTILPYLRTMAVTPDGLNILLLTQSGLLVVPRNFDDPVVLPPPPPRPVVSQVVNAADGGPGVAPGGLIVISGEALAGGSASAPGLPLPFTLGGTSVTVGGVAIPLLRVSPTEILGQLPFTVLGPVSLVVRTSRVNSDPFALVVQPFAPAIFRTGQAGENTRLATVIRARNNDFVNFTNPIHPGDVITIYLTGLGRVAPGVTLGEGAPSDPLALAITTPVVSIDGFQLAVDFAGLVPGAVGLYQINARVPDNIPSIAQATLEIRQGGASTSLEVRVVSP